MQIRTAILVAGTAAAMIAPSASAGIPWEPLSQAHSTTHYTLNQSAQSSGIAPTTENSFGQSKVSGSVNGVNKPKLKAKKTAAKAKKPASNVVTYIVEPMLPPSTAPTAPDPNACQNSMTDCTDEQLCELWGANCDVWAADVAAQARAADEQQPADDQPAAN